MSQQKFTLVELLVVIALIAALFGLVGPAFSRLLSSNDVDELTANIKLGIEQAQSHAAATRQYVAVIFASGDGNWVVDDDGNLDTDMNEKVKLGGYRLAIVNYDSGNKNSVSFLEWLPGSAWKVPPQGAKLLKIEQGKISDNLYVPGKTKENGGIADVKNYTGNSKLDADSSLVDLEKDGGTLKECALILSPYGGVARLDTDKFEQSSIFFLVGEALGQGSESLMFKSTDENGNPTNYRILQLNVYTGQVRYFVWNEVYD